MGNKIITEKDFWMCSSGAMPSQLQGTRKSLTKETGEIYITVEDKATASWIDFGCTKYWLLMALAAIAIVAVAIIVGALTVATGGLALVAIGAIAGLMGASVGLVMGALLCGQKVATKRIWSDSKSNFIAQGVNTITGNHTMTCAAGGTVKFAPNIKTWTDAIKVAALNYANILVEAAFLGAGAGLVAAFATGAIVLAIPTVASVLTNTAILAGTKVLSGASNYYNKDAVGEIHNSDEAWKAASPEYEAATRIYSNGMSSVSLNDVILFSSDVLLPFLHVKAKVPAPTVGPEVEVKTPAEENVSSPKEETNTPKEEPAKADEAKKEETVAPEAEAKPQEPEASGKTEDAYEEGQSKSEPPLSGKRPAQPEYPVLDENGKLTDYGKWYYERPSWKQKTINDVWNTAKTESPDGKVMDPLSARKGDPKEITWDKDQPRGDQWHMGHKEGYEFNKLQQSAAERKIGVDQFRSEYNTAEHVQPELPESNLSHEGEAPRDIYFGH
jgi:hypothetical protein